MSAVFQCHRVLLEEFIITAALLWARCVCSCCCILSALFTISIKSHRLSCNWTWLLICKLFIWVWTSKQLNTQTLCVGFVFMGSNLTWTWDESYALVLSDQISTQQNILYMEDSGLRCWTKLGKKLSGKMFFYRVPEPLLWQHMGGPRPY